MTNKQWLEEVKIYVYSNNKINRGDGFKKKGETVFIDIDSICDEDLNNFTDINKANFLEKNGYATMVHANSIEIENTKNRRT